MKKSPVVWALVFVAAGCGEPLVGDSLLTNRAPTIDAIADLTTPEDTTLDGVAVNVADDDVEDVLTVTVGSSDPSIVDVASVVIGGAGNARTLSIAPEPDAFGVVTLTVTVDDGAESASTSFELTVTPVNDAPVISGLADLTIDEDTVGNVSFTVSDVDDAVGDLVATASSDDATLLPDAGVVITGSGASRDIVVTPAPNESGTATVTVSVTDGDIVTMATFVVTVTAVNDPPTIEAVADQMTNEDTATGAIPVTIDDIDSPVAGLVLTCASSDAALVPEASCVVGGVDGDRTVVITPAANLHGTTTITLTVSDGTGSSTTMFMLTVVSVDDPPTITAIANDSIEEDPDPPPSYAFTIADVDDDVDTLLLSWASSNELIVDHPTGGSFGGTGGDRTITITPVVNESGTTTITVTVTDPDDAVDPLDLWASTSFVLDVQEGNDPPVIAAAFGDQAIDEDGSTGALDFTISDLEDLPDALAVSCTSDDAALVPASSCVTSCDAAGVCTVTVTPVADASGDAVVTVTVTDSGGLDDEHVFTLTVNPVNDPPVGDTYPLATDCNIHVDATPTIVADADDVEGDTVTIVEVTDASTTEGGLISIDADGVVLYRPPVGGHGVTDSYDYAISDGTDNGAGTIEITISDLCYWHVKNDELQNGDGSDLSPFDNLLDAETASEADSIILVFTGTGDATNQDLGITLKSGQQLLHAPADLDPGPPVITNTAGDAVTLVGGNAVSGFTITDADGFAIAGAAITGANAVTGVTITSANAAGGATGGIAVDGVAGSSLVLTDTIIDVASGTGLFVDTIGALTVTGTASIYVADGRALHLVNTTVDAVGGAHFDDVTSVDSSDGGVVLSSITGEVGIDILSLLTSAGVGLAVNSVDSLVILDGTIDSFGDAAVTIADATVDIVLGAIDCDANDAAVAALTLDTVDGTFLVKGDESINRNASGGVLAGADFPVTLVDSSNVTLAHMDIHQSDSGVVVDAEGVTDFTLSHSRLVGVDGGPAPGAQSGQLDLLEPRGAFLIENTAFEFPADWGVNVVTSGTSGADTLDIAGCELGGGLGGGVYVEADALADLAVVFTGTVTGFVDPALQVLAAGGALLSLDASGTFGSCDRALKADSVGGGSALFVDVHDSVVTSMARSAIAVISGDAVASTATVDAFFENNQLGDVTGLVATNAVGFGYWLQSRGAGALRVRIAGNTIYQPNETAVEATTSLGGPGGDGIHLTLENNDYTMASGVGVDTLSFGATASNPICVHLVDNVVTTSDRNRFTFDGSAAAPVNVQGFMGAGAADLLDYLETVGANIFGLVEVPDAAGVAGVPACDAPVAP